MLTRRRAALAVVAGAAITASAAPAATATAAPLTRAAAQMQVVPRGAPPDINGYGPAEFLGDGVRIRSCASTSCTIRGLGYRWHQVSWHCSGITSNGAWVHVYDDSTDVDGWSSSYYVDFVCE